MFKQKSYEKKLASHNRLPFGSRALSTAKERRKSLKTSKKKAHTFNTQYRKKR